jgi:hypothetical protein
MMKSKNAVDWPAKSRSDVNDLIVATAPAFSVREGRMTEQGGSFSPLRKSQGSGQDEIGLGELGWGCVEVGEGESGNGIDETGDRCGDSIGCFVVPKAEVIDLNPAETNHDAQNLQIAGLESHVGV